MKTTEEIFEDLETVVQDWKRKLEVIVAEGLKTIKKTTKERKMMMKYLPGDSLIGGYGITILDLLWAKFLMMLVQVKRNTEGSVPDSD